MKRRNRLAAGLLCAVLAAALVIPAAAHGCHGGRRQRRVYTPPVQVSVTVCPYEDCGEAGRHLHDGVTYCGYGHESGYCDGACRALCPYEDCGEAGRHLHDGVTYCGYGHESGYCDGTCLALCPLEDCGLTGRHLHGYTAYCGSHHDAGYCDGACAASASYGYGHHGCR